MCVCVCVCVCGRAREREYNVRARRYDSTIFEVSCIVFVDLVKRDVLTHVSEIRGYINDRYYYYYY